MRKIFCRSTLPFLFFLNVLHISAQLSPTVDSIPMSDGRKLAADVYIPGGITQGPVILIQTPYNRLFYRFSLPLRVGLNLNNSNYIFVIADWRGFYGSSAAAYVGNPGQGADGYDCVEWIAQQSWSNGKVGTWGASALGRVQFSTAKKNPPHLTCICPLVAGPQYEYAEYFPNGALRTEYVEQLDALGFGLSPILMANTIHNLLWTITENANFYPDSIRIPCYMIGGWYDHTIESMIPFYNAIRTLSPLNVRDQHRLLMGPWVHSGIGAVQQGELTYNNAAHWSDSLALLFFDFHLRLISNGWNTSPYVQYFQMGDDAWQSATTWPPSGTTNTDFYFHSSGLLDTNIPVSNSDSLFFNYNPSDPSPTIGGPTLRTDLEQGPYDQTDSVEGRNDILVFTTTPLSQNAVMKGSAIVHLKISSDKTDTDFDVRLTDVYPDGRSMLVNDGVMRMRFRNGNTAADTAVMTPGTVYDCVIPLPNTSISFLSGHKIRVDVTSSNYPRFNRNMNTGGAMYPGNSMDSLVNPLVATNTIYANSANKSFVILPLVGFVSGMNEAGAIKNGPEVFPNPATSDIKINLYSPGNFETEILNVLGEKLFCCRNQNSINVSSLANGIYFLKIRQGESIWERKFVKE